MLLCPFRWNAGYLMMHDGHHPGQMLPAHPPMMHAPPRPQPPPTGQVLAMQGGAQGVLPPPSVYGYPPPHMAVQMDPAAAGLGPITVAGPSHASGVLMPTGPIVTPQPGSQQTPIQQHPTMQPHPHMPPAPVQMMPSMHPAQMPNQLMGGGGIPTHPGTQLSWPPNAPRRE